MSAPSYSLITKEAALQSLIKGVKKAKRVALDTESNSLHHYYEKVCLMQLSFGDTHAIIDPLSDLEIAPFLTAIQEKTIILHAADYDLRMLNSTFKFRPKNPIFDTMIAAQLLGHQEFGLASLVNKFFKVKLSKQGQKANWAKRPLPKKELDYAINDTLYLERLADLLKEELEKKGRLDWHRETCERLVKATARSNKRRDQEDPWRIKGSHALDRQAQVFLRELWQWREKEAQKVDRPPFKVFDHTMLIQLSAWAATHVGKPITSFPRLPKKWKASRLQGIKEAIQKAEKIPKSAWPSPKKRTGTKPEKGPVVDALRAECARVAKKLEIQPHVIAPLATIRAISLKRPTTLKEMTAEGLMMRWQAELLEPGIRKVFQKNLS